MTRWVPVAALVALSALLVGTMWVVPYLPTNDGPEWIFATHAENHYADLAAPYADVHDEAFRDEVESEFAAFGVF